MNYCFRNFWVESDSFSKQNSKHCHEILVYHAHRTKHKQKCILLEKGQTDEYSLAQEQYAVLENTPTASGSTKLAIDYEAINCPSNEHAYAHLSDVKQKRDNKG